MQEEDKIGKMYSLENTYIRKLLLTPQHVGRCCTNVIWGRCCILGHSCTNAILGNCCATMFSTMGTLGSQCFPTMGPLLRKCRHERVHTVFFAYARGWRTPNTICSWKASLNNPRLNQSIDSPSKISNICNWKLKDVTRIFERVLKLIKVIPISLGNFLCLLVPFLTVLYRLLSD
jgi:hypothetical protein